MSAEPTKRQTLPWPWWRRLYHEAIVRPLDLDDGTGDGSPSMAKMLALVFGLLLIWSVVRSKPITGVQFGFAAMVLSAAFGRSVYKLWLTRHRSEVTASDTTARLEQRVLQEIVTRRKEGAEDGSEPTP